MTMIRDKAFEYIRSHPGCTNVDIGEGIGANPNMMATYTKIFCEKGVVRREIQSSTLSNRPIFAHWAIEGARLTTDADGKTHILPPNSKEQSVSKAEEYVSQPEEYVSIPKTKQSKTKGHHKTQHESSLDALVDQIAAQLVHSVVARVKSQLVTELGRMLPAPAKAPEVKAEVQPEVQPEVVQEMEEADVAVDAEPTAPVFISSPPKLPVIEQAQPRKPRVGITGLLPQQAGMIQSEFCDTFDITFWNDRNGDGHGTLRAMGKNCDIVFFHKNHATHNTQDILKNVGANFVVIGGGMTQLRDALTKYYVEQVAV